MENPVVWQLSVLAAAAAWGGALGLFYEICSVFRLVGGFWRNAAADAAFWAVSLAGSFLFLLLVNGGEPRGYALLGIGVGLLAVRALPGRALRGLLLPLKRKLQKRAAERAGRKRAGYRRDEKKEV